MHHSDPTLNYRSQPLLLKIRQKAQDAYIKYTTAVAEGRGPAPSTALSSTLDPMLSGTTRVSRKSKSVAGETSPPTGPDSPEGDASQRGTFAAFGEAHPTLIDHLKSIGDPKTVPLFPIGSSDIQMSGPMKRGTPMHLESPLGSSVPMTAGPSFAQPMQSIPQQEGEHPWNVPQTILPAAPDSVLHSLADPSHIQSQLTFNPPPSDNRFGTETWQQGAHSSTSLYQTMPTMHDPSYSQTPTGQGYPSQAFVQSTHTPFGYTQSQHGSELQLSTTAMGSAPPSSGLAGPSYPTSYPTAGPSHSWGQDPGLSGDHSGRVYDRGVASAAPGGLMHSGGGTCVDMR